MWAEGSGSPDVPADFVVNVSSFNAVLLQLPQASRAINQAQIDEEFTRDVLLPDVSALASIRLLVNLRLELELDFSFFSLDDATVTPDHVYDRLGRRGGEEASTNRKLMRPTEHWFMCLSSSFFNYFFFFLFLLLLLLHHHHHTSSFFCRSVIRLGSESRVTAIVTIKPLRETAEFGPFPFDIVDGGRFDVTFVHAAGVTALSTQLPICSLPVLLASASIMDCLGLR